MPIDRMFVLMILLIRDHPIGLVARRIISLIAITTSFGPGCPIRETYVSPVVAG
jgi:hypothetical protein